MNLAIEYITRHESKDIADLPCSLLIEHNLSSIRIVITINYNIHDKKKLTVKHWLLDSCTSSDVLPPFKEYIVNTSDLFISEYIIMKNFTILEFTDSTFPSGRKQYPDAPYAGRQEEEYRDYILMFFNPKSNLDSRENWLWKTFSEVYKERLQQSDITINLYNCYGFGVSSQNNMSKNQMEKVKDKNKKLWKIWCQWTSRLLNFQNRIATELIFAKKYSEHTKKCAEENKIINSFYSDNHYLM